MKLNDSIKIIVLGVLVFSTQTLAEVSSKPSLFPACPKWNQCGYINAKGEMVIKPVYSYVQEFSEGMAGVGMISGDSSVWGYIDETGQEIVRPQYDYVREFSEGLGLVRIDESGNLNGFVDKSGKLVIGPREGWVFPFSDGLALFHCKVPGAQSDPSKVAYWRGFINKKGEVAIPCNIFDADPFSEGLAPACLNLGCGFIDRDGDWVIKPVYNETKPFSEGLAAVEVTGKDKSRIWGYIDKTGRFVVPPKYERAMPFSEGLAAVSEHYPTYGYIDKTGELIIPMKFEGAENFSEGFAVVYVGSGDEYSQKYRYIDRQGKYTSRKVYFAAWGFKNGIAGVGKVNFWTKLFKDTGLGRGLMTETAYYIDKNEKVIWKATKKL